MAASLRKLSLSNSVSHIRPNVHNQPTCPVRQISCDRTLLAKFSDAHRQELEKEAQPSVESTLLHKDYFGVKKLVTLQDLFHARVHLGHNAGLRHVSMTPFIFGERQSADIINLEHTLPLLHHALNVFAHIVYRGGIVLFLSRNMQILPWVERMAKDVGEYSHCRPWKRGTFTDAANVFGTLPIYPDVCVFFNTQDTVFEVHRGIVESAKLLVPTIAIVDTNCDISNVTYPVPGNDDSPASQRLFIDLFRKTTLLAKEKRKEDGLV
ncbi:unnamed protein product [Candidula unifasciata]|uniref:Ribosomal protein S2 n=1 Tax=Candidula unifasciata TaxID=100452 RepID=A0A8S3ZIY1_9EUPU|nr:unnamed protein product [Candidula unifasciata]